MTEKNPFDGAEFAPVYSVLSSEPDGFGYYYGFYANDPRLINVRKEADVWLAYVGSDELPTLYNTKDAAEAAAIAFLKTGRRT